MVQLVHTAISQSVIRKQTDRVLTLLKRGEVDLWFQCRITAVSEHSDPNLAASQANGEPICVLIPHQARAMAGPHWVLHWTKGLAWSNFFSISRDRLLLAVMHTHKSSWKQHQIPSKIIKEWMFSSIYSRFTLTFYPDLPSRNASAFQRNLDLEGHGFPWR